MHFLLVQVDGTATALSNFVVAGRGASGGFYSSGGTISGSYVILPSGGTWRYVGISGSSTYSTVMDSYGTIAGGGRISLGSENDYDVVIACRIS